MTQLSLNILVSQIKLTAFPYELIAIDTSTDRPNVVLITLKPFQIRPLNLSITPKKVSPLYWGYLISGEQNALLLDRSAAPVNFLQGLSPASEVISVDTTTLLISSPPTDSLTADEPPSLCLAELKELDLELIF